MKSIYVLPIFLIFYLSIHFQTFSYFFQFFHLKQKKPISAREPWQFPSSNEHVNSNTTVMYWYSAPFCCCLISLENYNFLQGKILPIHPFSHFFNLYPTFFHFKWKKPISSRKPSQFLVSLPIWKEYVNSTKVFIFSTFLAVVSLVFRITASCKGKYLLNHTFQTFFQFCPVSSTSGGRNLFLLGQFKPGFNLVSSIRWKKPANPGERGSWFQHVIHVLI